MEVAIHRFETPYRLAISSESEQRRLDRLRMGVLDRAFQMAAARAGLSEDAELCIRSLSAPVRLRLNASNEAISTMWSDALAEEIVRTMRYGHSTRVVIYQSRRQALLDITLSVIRGDLRRAWAWRQLKLWRAGHVAGEQEAIGELVHALGSAPAMVVPALNTLARMGYLDAFAKRLTSAHWESLARAVLTEVGMESLLDADSEGPSSRSLNDAWRALNSSRLLRAIAAGGHQARSRATLRAVAALAIMETDPGSVRKKSARRVIDIVADAIASKESVTDLAGANSHKSVEAKNTREKLIERAATQTSAEVELSATTEQVLEATEIDQDEPRPELTSTGNAEPARSKGALTRRESTNRSATEFQEVAEQLEKETELVDFRTRAFSRYAGLLFLIAIIADLDLPERILTDTLLGARPFAWVLHQLALVLAPIQPQDPAALAFAGLAPDAEPPSKDEPGPSTDEARLLSDLAEQIVAQLLARLDCEDQTKDSVLEFVTRRRAEIVADPGWIEVKFSLDDVKTEIRRARLDLNPGYVPWLGIVVMFVYE